MQKYIGIGVAVVLLGMGWWGYYSQKRATLKTETKTETTEEIIMKRADGVIVALMTGEMEKVAEVVDTEKGVIFSPDAHIDAKINKFGPEEVKNWMTDSKTYNWGKDDGSGKEMVLGKGPYFEKFVYDQDFAGAEVISFNKKAKEGNTIDNAAEIWPYSKFVEYHFSGFEKKYEGMDWESLRLYFEEKDGQWWLVGVVHDGWTI